jgi:uncharacterized protein (TIGR00106 family)
MKAIADVCIVPIGVGVSLSKYVTECERIFFDANLKTRLHGYGTNVEGSWDDVVGAIKKCHEALHGKGVPRISTNIRIGTRTDRTQTTDEKILSVEKKLGKLKTG